MNSSITYSMDRFNYNQNWNKFIEYEDDRYCIYKKQQLSTFLYVNGICLVGIYLCDLFIKKICKKSRWFMLHAVTNIVISYITITDVISSILEPENSSQQPSILITGNIAFVLHFYHCIMFKLRIQDWLHHIMSCFVFIPTCMNYVSKGLSVFYFFCTGFPGAIDYMYLSLEKENFISKKKRKHMTSLINAYIRMPGGILASSLLFKDGIICYQKKFIGVDLIVLSIMIYINSCFYAKQAIESYGVYKTIHNKRS